MVLSILTEFGSPGLARLHLNFPPVPLRAERSIRSEYSVEIDTFRGSPCAAELQFQVHFVP